MSEVNTTGYIDQITIPSGDIYDIINIQSFTWSISTSVHTATITSNYITSATQIISINVTTGISNLQAPISYSTTNSSISIYSSSNIGGSVSGTVQISKVALPSNT